MIRRQVGVFLIVGSLTVALDCLIYRALLVATSLPLDWAKAGGFLAGTCFAYLANRYWTFAQQRQAAGSVPRFVLLYAATLGGNVGVNAWVLHSLAGWPFAWSAAFLVATGFSATLNFLGMKWLVFRPAPADSDSVSSSAAP